MNVYLSEPGDSNHRELEMSFIFAFISRSENEYGPNGGRDGDDIDDHVETEDVFQPPPPSVISGDTPARPHTENSFDDQNHKNHHLEDRGFINKRFVFLESVDCEEDCQYEADGD